MAQKYSTNPIPDGNYSEDWGNDSRVNLPYSGESVQKFIKDELKKKLEQQEVENEVQSQIDDGGFTAHGGSSTLEATGHQIDQDDHHNAGVAHVLAEHIQFFTDFDLGGQQQRHGDAGQQSHVTGELTEGTLNTHQSECDAAAHIQGQEHDQGKKCGCA